MMTSGISKSMDLTKTQKPGYLENETIFFLQIKKFINYTSWATLWQNIVLKWVGLRYWWGGTPEPVAGDTILVRGNLSKFWLINGGSSPNYCNWTVCQTSSLNNVSNFFIENYFPIITFYRNYCLQLTKKETLASYGVCMHELAIWSKFLFH